jgi:hypothetical protein
MDTRQSYDRDTQGIGFRDFESGLYDDPSYKRGSAAEPPLPGRDPVFTRWILARGQEK